MIAKKNLYPIASSMIHGSYAIPQSASLLVAGTQIQEPKRKIVSWHCEIVAQPNRRLKTNS